MGRGIGRFAGGAALLAALFLGAVVYLASFEVPEAGDGAPAALAGAGSGGMAAAGDGGMAAAGDGGMAAAGGGGMTGAPGGPTTDGATTGTGIAGAVAGGVGVSGVAGADAALPATGVASLMAADGSGAAGSAAGLAAGQSGAARPDYAVEPDILEEFDYPSMQEFAANPRGIYATSEDLRLDRMALDGGALRYDYPAGRETDFTISRTIRLPELSEVWVEAVVRWSPGFTIRGNGQPAGPAQKLLHVGIHGPAGRFGVNLEAETIRAEGPNDNYEGLYIHGRTTTSQLFDGRWHTVRYHVRLAGGNGEHTFQVDGVRQGTARGRTGATALWAVALGRNLNMLAARPQSMWWDRIAIWTRDPGW